MEKLDEEDEITTDEDTEGYNNDTAIYENYITIVNTAPTVTMTYPDGGTADECEKWLQEEDTPAFYSTLDHVLPFDNRWEGS